jgi:hypothetical protein
MYRAYPNLIRECLAQAGRIGTDPRHVEAWMRLEHGTLDALSRKEFAREVEIAAQCVEAAGAADSEALAASLGL